MDIIKRLYHSNVLLIVISIGLFALGVYTHNVNSVILHMLEFTVIFELVRTFNHYFKDGQFKVRYALDAAIFFSIKELYIGFSEFKLNADYMLLVISLGALVVLMGIRHFNALLIEEKAKLCTNTCK